MSDLLLVPLEDTVVFPGMTVTLTVDTGAETEVLLVPQHGAEYAKVGTVARVDERVRLPRGAGTAVVLTGLHRGVIGAARTDVQGNLRVEVEEIEDENPAPVKTRELEREYRAIVEEILELRDADERIGQFLRSITEAGALADTCAYAPDISFAQRVELLETVDVVERLEFAVEAAARAARRAAGARPHPRRRGVRCAEAAARVVPAPAAQLDPQGARRGRRVRRRGVPHEDRGSRHAGRRPRTGRA